MQKIKEEKGRYWSQYGAAEKYERAVTSTSGLVQVKNNVELHWVKRYARGKILDAGTGTGRFAIPLAKDEKNSITALDFSPEMLRKNSAKAKELGLAIDYYEGDVEKLPFADDSFDCVVSITVVRHFPEWRNILREYRRVLKPGGLLIFEMCSGDHIASANRIRNVFGAKNHLDFMTYEAEIRFRDLRKFLREIGVTVEKRFAYDFFNSNCFQKIITFNQFGYRVFLKTIKTLFLLPGAVTIWTKAEIYILSRLHSRWSYNYMIIAKKNEIET